MPNHQFKGQFLGYVTREGGIPYQEWEAYAQANPKLEKPAPVTMINPFTNTEVSHQSHGYVLYSEADQVGLLVWEDTECISIYGEARELQPFIQQLCYDFRGVFERVTS